MKTTWNHCQKILTVLGLTAALLPVVSFAKTIPSTNEGFVVISMVSNVASNSPITVDPVLVNPWGLVSGPKSIWVNDNGTGKFTAYKPTGKSFNSVNAVPGPSGPGTPTGLAVNGSGAFVITNGNKFAAANFLIATEDGNILAWNQTISTTGAVVVVHNAGSAIYKGLAIVVNNTNGESMVYAANFASGNIDVYDSHFRFVKSFTDESLPSNYAPFNVRNIQGRVFVTFAHKVNSSSTDDDAGPGNGFVDIFDTDGKMLRQFAANGVLNSPWGIALAPLNFGHFSGALIVGNFGDGRINAFDLLTGKFLGPFKNSAGGDLIIPGLWGLDFESEEDNALDLAYNASALYFTSGPNDEANGLFGIIRPIAPNLSPAR